MIAELLAKLEPDPWRIEAGFSSEMSEAQHALKSATEEQATSIINEWIHRHQTCLFGRAAAKTNRLSYCTLLESDLHRPDEHLKARIQAARTEWTRQGFKGEKSGFVIAAISDRLAAAAPSEALRNIACRLCSLYLLQDVEPDRIYLDRLWLEKPGDPVAVWEWAVGVNYFSAQGDLRWWRDHRFPGGMAFSMNSVGHMMKSAALSNSMAAMNEAMGIPSSPSHRPQRLDSLGSALNFAMRTIQGASEGVSGPATFLLPEEIGDVASRPSCPIDLPQPFLGHSYCQYGGWYHTDVSVPAEYFLPDVERGAHVPQHRLDFTYLFHRHFENPDYETMGAGRRIRDADQLAEPLDVSSKMHATDVRVDSCARLQAALKGVSGSRSRDS